MRPSPAVLVIGGGIMGASIAYHLSVAGVGRVLLCEQSRLPGLGATAKAGGIVRMHHTDPFQARLAWESYPVYAEWSDAIGGECGFQRTGFAMVVGPEHVEALHANARMLRGLGIPLSVLSRESFAELQPFCNTADIGAVAYEPFSGYADPILATLGFVRRARERGLELLEGARITGLVYQGGRVTGAYSNFGVLSAGLVVVAASVWAGPLLAEAAVTLPVCCKQVDLCFLSWPQAEPTPLCTYLDDTIGTYFRPEPGRQVLVGAGAKQCDPGAAPLVAAEDMQMARSRAGHRVPLLQQADFAGGRSGFDGYTPDKRGIVGPVKGVSGLYLALGFSGGGFKIAPAVGRAVAAEIAGSAEAPQLQRFRLERFQSGNLIQAEHPYVHM